MRHRFSIHAAVFSVVIILMLSIFGQSFLMPKVALASVAITPSSDRWYGPGLIRVVITDTSQSSAGASIAPHIAVKRGSITLASADPPITSPGTSGTFELYFTTSNAPFGGPAPAVVPVPVAAAVRRWSGRRPA